MLFLSQPLRKCGFAGLVDARNDSPADNLLVLFPVVAVLAVALFVVSSITVDQENGKVHDIEVRDGNGPAFGAALDDLAAIGKDIRGLEAIGQAASGHDLVAGQAGGQAVGPRLDPVSEIVDVTGDTPPARSEKLAASLGLYVLEVRNLGVVGIGTERILLKVGGAKDVEAQSNDREHTSKTNWAERQRMDGQVTSLLRVHERNPDKVTECKHHAKAVRGNVHGCQNGRLKPPRVENVQGLDNCNANDAIGNETIVAVLLGTPRAVEDNPTHHAGTELAPFLEINLTDKGDNDAWVELATDVPIVEQVSSVSTSCQLSVLFVASLHAEAADVYKSCKTVGNQDAGCEELHVVFADEDPNGEVGSLGNSTGGEQRESQSV